jgi:hypothetical protein
LAKGDEWDVFEYEWNMARLLWATLAANTYQNFEQTIKNVVVEGLVLHTRILIEILLSNKGEPDDIVLSELMPTFNSSHIAALRAAYGESKTVHAPRWLFNKMLAHATAHRANTHDYIVPLRAVWPHIFAIMAELATHTPAPPFSCQ